MAGRQLASDREGAGTDGSAPNLRAKPKAAPPGPGRPCDARDFRDPRASRVSVAQLGSWKLALHHTDREKERGRVRKWARDRGEDFVFPALFLSVFRTFFACCYGGVLCGVRGAAGMGGVRAVRPPGGLPRVHGEDALRHGGRAVLHLQAGVHQRVRH